MNVDEARVICPDFDPIDERDGRIRCSHIGLNNQCSLDTHGLCELVKVAGKRPFSVTSSEEILASAQKRVLDQIEDGIHCPCCRQHCKVYKRILNSGMALCMLLLYRGEKRRWVHAHNFLASRTSMPGVKVALKNREWAKLFYWDLMVEQPKDVDDNHKKTSGIWSITEKGEEFVTNAISVPKYIRLYDNELLGYAGPSWSIVDALGKNFHYEDLMAL